MHYMVAIILSCDTEIDSLCKVICFFITCLHYYQNKGSEHVFTWSYFRVVILATVVLFQSRQVRFYDCQRQ